MNITAAALAGVVGCGFFAACSAFYYQPSAIKSEAVVDAVFTTQKGKARAAVTRLLLNPAGAEFDGMRVVEVDGAKYVCGAVKAKDRKGSYAGHRAFVYTASIDFARIDDDGTIAQKHDAYRVCPITEEEEKIAQMRLVSPNTLKAIGAVSKALPSTTDTTVLAEMAGHVQSGAGGGGRGGSAGGGSMQGQLQQFGGGSGGAGSGGMQGSGAFKVAAATPAATPPAVADSAVADEVELFADKPQAGWPSYPPEHVLAKPAQKRSQTEAIALAKDVEQRWTRFKAGEIKTRPTLEQIQEAQRGLLTIGAKSKDYPAAWSAFVRLRGLERDASTQADAAAGAGRKTR